MSHQQTLDLLASKSQKWRQRKSWSQREAPSKFIYQWQDYKHNGYAFWCGTSCSLASNRPLNLTTACFQELFRWLSIKASAKLRRAVSRRVYMNPLRLPFGFSEGPIVIRLLSKQNLDSAWLQHRELWRSTGPNKSRIVVRRRVLKVVFPTTIISIVFAL